MELHWPSPTGMFHGNDEHLSSDTHNMHNDIITVLQCFTEKKSGTKMALPWNHFGWQ